MRALLALLLVVTTTSGGGGGQIGGSAENDYMAFYGAQSGAGSALTHATQAGPSYAYRRFPAQVCGTVDAVRTRSPRPCVDGIETQDLDRVCDDGSTALAPLYRRLLDEDGRLTAGSSWEQVDNGGCPEDPNPDVVLTAADFRRLPLVPRAPVIQPGDGRALVTMGIAVHTDDAPQELTTTILGLPVQVRATPARFTWDFGDGTVITTSHAGGEWPGHAALGEYPDPGTYELRLTTTWSGEFQVAGTGPWLPVAGTATTTSDPITITVETAPSRLVADR